MIRSWPELFTSDLLRRRKSGTCFVKERHVFAHVLTNMLRSHVILLLASASPYGPSRPATDLAQTVINDQLVDQLMHSIFRWGDFCVAFLG